MGAVSTPEPAVAVLRMLERVAVTAIGGVGLRRGVSVMVGVTVGVSRVALASEEGGAVVASLMAGSVGPSQTAGVGSGTSQPSQAVRESVRAISRARRRRTGVLGKHRSVAVAYYTGRGAAGKWLIADG